MLIKFPKEVKVLDTEAVSVHWGDGRHLLGRVRSELKRKQKANPED
jgi:hypothetical protein